MYSSDKRIRIFSKDNEDLTEGTGKYLEKPPINQPESSVSFTVHK